MIPLSVQLITYRVGVVVFDKLLNWLLSNGIKVQIIEDSVTSLNVYWIAPWEMGI